jgi:hypothetical protein
VTRHVDQNDICPTVGELLRFRYPKARGVALHEMLDFSPSYYSGTDYGPGYGNQRLTWSEDNSITPQIASSEAGDGETVFHVVYAERVDGRHEIRYIGSSDAGETWSQPARLSGPGELDAHVPALAVSGDTVHAVWVGCLPHEDNGAPMVPRWYLRHRESTDGGVSWGEIVSLCGSKYERHPTRQNPSWTVWDPAICYDGECIMSILVGYGVEFEKSRVGCYYSCLGSTCEGKSWVDAFATIPLHADLATESWEQERLAYAVWYDVRDEKVGWTIKCTRSINGGTDWADPRPLVVDSTYCADPTVVSQLPHVGICWAHYEDAIWQTYFRRSTDYGQNWHPVASVSNADCGAIDPELIVGADGNYYCFWANYDISENSVDSDVVYKYSTGAGESWSDQLPTVVSLGQSYSVRPSACEHGGVVWEDYRHGNWEIYFDRF